MLSNNEQLGAFIVPTGVGAAVGGYAGDASVWARKFSQLARLIVNPNVVNAGGFSGINEKMLYVEGRSLDSFFKGEISLVPGSANKIGVVFDRAIPQDVLNIHINTINAVKTVYGIDVIGYEVTQAPVGVEFLLNRVSAGSVRNIETLIEASKKLLAAGADAIALVCLFEDPESVNPDYAQGCGVDPVGGVEAIVSHYVSRELRVPCAHSPAFRDFTISPALVDAKSASEYITPTFLPCVLLGLDKAPKLVSPLNPPLQGGQNSVISINHLDFLIMPYDSLGSTPVFEAVKRGITVYAVRENTTALNVTAESLGLADKIIEVQSYQECFQLCKTSARL
ncbi:MAG: DUF3326 domain-containing protein [Heliobacteriaceae bacterium]|jgi:hypothetical protein|nr:DUF3326 domain-containing protein [Heliobacteriaceae bacterium]